MPGESDLLSTLSRMALSFQVAPTGVPGRIWDELRPWLARLAVNAAPKWLPRLMFGFPCAVPVYQGGRPVARCAKNAVASCDACGEACCLDHARIDQFGDAICYLCVASLVNERRNGAAPEEPQPPPPAAETPGPSAKDLTWARRMLKVTKDDSLDEVRASHRRLSGKWHPDRHRAPAANAKAEQKFKDVQRAFDLLQRDYEQQEAA